MAFNPNDYMMNLKGKEYLQVAWRLVWFREEHPDYSLNTEMVHYDAQQQQAIFKATICDNNGTPLSSGYGSEAIKDFHDFIEKAETKVVGRCLAMLGYGTQFAADELDEGERIVDSPVERKTAKKGNAANAAAPAAPAKTEKPKAPVAAPAAVQTAINKTKLQQLCKDYAAKNGLSVKAACKLLEEQLGKTMGEDTIADFIEYLENGVSE